MKICPKCKKEVNDAAKFCGGCGSPFDDVALAKGESVCRKCGSALRPGTKFCGKCGSKIEVAESDASTNVERVGDSGFIRWNILPGQIAVKITEREIEACGKVRGIVIQDGTKALLFANGKIVAELPAGSYRFNAIKDPSVPVVTEAETRAAGFWAGLWRSCEAAVSAVSKFFHKVVPGATELSIVLVRTTDFPLIFSVKNASTANIRSDVGINVHCRITNVNDFYVNMLTDRGFVSADSLRSILEVVVRNRLNGALANVSPENVANNAELVSSVLVELQEGVAAVYSYISVVRILELTADNSAIENLRRLSEELYVSERELDELQKRNDFLNRLQAVKNEQSLTEGQSSADFEKKKLDIYRQMELTKDEQGKFDLFLAAERKLRAAKSENDVEAALQEYKKSGLVREQELSQFRHQGKMSDIRNIGMEQLAEAEGEVARERVRDAYSDERRRAEMQLDRDEQQNQLEVLRQAQAIRQEREEAEHRRAMAAEQQKIDARLENQRIYAGMSFEQIMAANPDITPEAAKALAAKFGADNKDELLRMREKDFERMQQMMTAAMGAKQMDIERVRTESERSNDRMLAGVQSAVTAAGQAFSGKVSSSSRQSRKDEGAKTEEKCPKCSAVLEPGASFCAECGTAL